MLKIRDPLLARMWWEKFYIVLALAVVALVVSGAVDFRYSGRPVIAIVVGLSVVLIFVNLLEVRYRMHKGSYGMRRGETEDFDRWLEKKGAKHIDDLTLPG